MADPIPPNSRKEQHAAARRADALRRHNPSVQAYTNWAAEQAARIRANSLPPRIVFERTPTGGIGMRFEMDAETAETLQQLAEASRIIIEQERATYGIRRPLDYYDARRDSEDINLFQRYGMGAYIDGVHLDESAEITADEWAGLTALFTPPANG